MLAFRVADRRRPIFDPTGARLNGSRWNSQGLGVIYTAQTYAGALLEVLVHQNLGEVPKTHAHVLVTIPDDLPSETLTVRESADWDIMTSRAFGDRWIVERRSAILLVPSVVLQGREQNILINPLHTEFPRIHASDPASVVWDTRLFPNSTRPR
jgi:RES domain-containing protein